MLMEALRPNSNLGHSHMKAGVVAQVPLTPGGQSQGDCPGSGELAGYQPRSRLSDRSCLRDQGT